MLTKSEIKHQGTMMKANGGAGSEHEGMISGGAACNGGSQCNVRNEWAMAIQCK